MYISFVGCVFIFILFNTTSLNVTVKVTVLPTPVSVGLVAVTDLEPATVGVNSFA